MMALREFALDKPSEQGARCLHRHTSRYESHHSQTDKVGDRTPRRIAEARRGISDPHRARMARGCPAYVLLGLLTTSVGLAGTVSAPYQIGTWQGFRQAAITYTFDDDLPNQYSIAVPMFNAKGFKMTLFTVTIWLPGRAWSLVQTAASFGHEVASHTVAPRQRWR